MDQVSPPGGGLAGVGYTDCKHKIVELKMCALGPSSPAGRLA